MVNIRYFAISSIVSKINSCNSSRNRGSRCRTTTSDSSSNTILVVEIVCYY